MPAVKVEAEASDKDDPVEEIIDEEEVVAP